MGKCPLKITRSKQERLQEMRLANLATKAHTGFMASTFAMSVGNDHCRKLGASFHAGLTSRFARRRKSQENNVTKIGVKKQSDGVRAVSFLRRLETQQLRCGKVTDVRFTFNGLPITRPHPWCYDTNCRIWLFGLRA